MDTKAPTQTRAAMDERSESSSAAQLEQFEDLSSLSTSSKASSFPLSSVAKAVSERSANETTEEETAVTTGSGEGLHAEVNPSSSPNKLTSESLMKRSASTENKAESTKSRLLSTHKSDRASEVSEATFYEKRTIQSVKRSFNQRSCNRIEDSAEASSDDSGYRPDNMQDSASSADERLVSCGNIGTIMLPPCRFV